VTHGKLKHPVKHHSTTSRAASVETEHELVQVAGQMRIVEGVLSATDCSPGRAAKTARTAAEARARMSSG
jgi:hypothetical protein